MDGERTTREAIEAFMQSELSETVVRRGSEITFAQQVDTWIRTLNFDEWEAYPTYLQDELVMFLEDEINAGRLQGVSDTPDAGRQGERYDGVWASIYNRGLEAMVARQAEVYRDQPMREGIADFVESSRGDGWEVVSSDMRQSFTGRLLGLMRDVDVDRWEGDLGYRD